MQKMFYKRIRDAGLTKKKQQKKINKLKLNELFYGWYVG